MGISIEDLAVDFRLEEIPVLKTAYERAVTEIAKHQAVDFEVELELGKLVFVEARRRLRLGLRLADRRDAEVLAFMTTGSFFHQRCRAD